MTYIWPHRALIYITHHEGLEDSQVAVVNIICNPRDDIATETEWNNFSCVGFIPHQSVFLPLCVRPFSDPHKPQVRSLKSEFLENSFRDEDFSEAPAFSLYPHLLPCWVPAELYLWVWTINNKTLTIQCWKRETQLTVYNVFNRRHIMLFQSFPFL